MSISTDKMSLLQKLCLISAVTFILPFAAADGSDDVANGSKLSKSKVEGQTPAPSVPLPVRRPPIDRASDKESSAKKVTERAPIRQKKVTRWAPRRITVQADDVTLREFQKYDPSKPLCDGTAPTLDVEGNPVYAESIACPVVVNRDKDVDARKVSALPVGTEMLVIEEVLPNVIRYSKKSTDGNWTAKVSTHRWSRKIQFYKIPGMSQKEVDAFNKRFFVIYQGSLFRGNTGGKKKRNSQNQCEMSRPEDPDLPTLKNSKCYSTLSKKFRSRISRDGLKFLLHYHEKYRGQRLRFYNADKGRMDRKKINNNMVAFIDYSERSTNKRFHLIDLKSCQIRYSTGLSHGGGSIMSAKDLKEALRTNDFDFHKRLQKKYGKGWKQAKRQLIDRYKKEAGRKMGHCGAPKAWSVPGYVKTCTHPKDRVEAWQMLLGKRAMHSFYNMARPGLFFTYGLHMRWKDINGVRKPRWPLANTNPQFNNVLWTGIDQRGKKAIQRGVKPHAATYAPTGRSFGCPAFRPKVMDKLRHLGWHKQVMTFVWIPQCEYF